MPFVPSRQETEQEEIDLGLSVPTEETDRSLVKGNASVLPEMFLKNNPMFSKLYGLFESHYPTTGHLAGTVAIDLASMCTDESRPFNSAIGAEFAEGKSTVSKQFRRIPNVNSYDSLTYAAFLLDNCGAFLTAPGKRSIPNGAKTVPVPGKKTAIQKSTVDRISNYFDIIKEGDSLFSTGDPEHLVSLYNSLLEEGTWKGGDDYSGRYEFGMENPVKHGLILFVTPEDFQRNVLHSQSRFRGFSSRLVLLFYKCSKEEREDTVMGIMHGILKEKEFSGEVAEILKNLSPMFRKTIQMPDESDKEFYEEAVKIRSLLQSFRGETTGKRAARDTVRILKAVARLEDRTKVNITDSLLVRACLTMSLRGKANLGEQLPYYGDKKHFLVAAHLFENPSTTAQSMKNVLTYNGGRSLYSDGEIEQAVMDIGSFDK